MGAGSMAEQGMESISSGLEMLQLSQAKNFFELKLDLYVLYPEK